MKRFLLCLLTAIAFAGARPSVARADDLSIEASVAKSEITMDEQLLLFVTVKGSANVTTPKLPTIPNFDSYSTGRSQSVSIVNGSMSSSVTFNYVLMPKAAGRFTIPPIEISQGGQTLATHPINIEVTSASAQPPQTPHRPSPIGANESIEGVMIRAHVNKRQVVVQEPVILTIQFLRRVRFLSRPSYAPPDTTGWMTYDLQPIEYTTTIQGMGFSVTEFKYELFPTAPGRLTIGPATIECSVENFQADPFDVFFQNFFQSGQSKTLKTKAITVEVAPLPESGKPGGFSGSVGQYALSANLDKSTVKAGDPITLTLEVKGEGNIKTIGEPSIPPIPSFRRYETISSLNTQSQGNRISGSKAFKTAFVPEDPGTFSIGPARFDYFDPIERRYISLKSKTLTLTVTPGTTGPPVANPAGMGSAQSEEVHILKEDIRYLKPAPSPARPFNQKLDLLALGAFNLLPLLLLAGSGGFRLSKERDLKNPEGARSRKALTQARERLKKARQHLQDSDPNLYLRTVSSAVAGYVADKLGVSKTGLALDDAARELEGRRVDQKNIQGLRELWEIADRGRFAPIAMTNTERQALYQRALSLITQIEEQIR